MKKITVILAILIAVVTAQAGQSISKLELETARDRLQFDQNTGVLLSIRSKAVPDQELLEVQDGDPLFIIQYLDENRQFRQITSLQAKDVDIKKEILKSGAVQETQIVAVFRNINGLKIDVTAKVWASTDDRFSRWSISLTNRGGLQITDVQYPFICMPFDLGGKGDNNLLWPFTIGRLLKNPSPRDLRPDSPSVWQFAAQNGETDHYPGVTFAQFLAYFNERSGLYVSCQDSSGRVKWIKPVARMTRLRLGFAHVGDWPTRGKREMEYDVVVGSVAGDWYDVAGLYRDWSLKQHWAKTPLHARKDVPDWLLDSPTHVTVRVQGEKDNGPAEPKEQFLPYPKIIPLLEKLASRTNNPVLPVIMSWERPGPWIYPESFPAVSGEQSFLECTELARQKGWHVGIVSNGTRWVSGQYWSGYDGREYFEKNGGPESVCRNNDGTMWKQNSTWRWNFPTCIASPITKRFAKEHVKKLIEMGIDAIQFMDQNVGACSFACYATDHGHPSVPGKWMTDEMDELLDAFDELAQAEYKRTNGQRQIAYYVEWIANEYHLSRYQVCESGVVPDKYYKGLPYHYIGLYDFLYHEFILLEAAINYVRDLSPAPYHLEINNACNLVMGIIPAVIMKGDGTLLGKNAWAPWEPPVGNNENGLQTLKSTAALRREQGKPWLVFGRMLRPANVLDIRTISWQRDDRIHHKLAVLHAAWQAPDGRTAVVLANWTTETQEVRVIDERLGDKVLVTVSSDELKSAMLPITNGGFTVSLPKLSCVLLESPAGEFSAMLPKK